MVEMVKSCRNDASRRPAGPPTRPSSRVSRMNAPMMLLLRSPRTQIGSGVYHGIYAGDRAGLQTCKLTARDLQVCNFAIPHVPLTPHVPLQICT
jgi:hypothetical protein